MNKLSCSHITTRACEIKAVADINAVVASHITFDVTAAQSVFGNKAAPIPQSTYGLAALEFKLKTKTGTKQFLT